mmetsp:Transcript_53295/g.79176  ORF Transcript_53295/g.79176 Transcript_53295/m.79176 type:complete len:291 (-) Transcript_53295:83-955(-)|eukprot:CAMPEP_0195521306 /NCGR_PEP_ID=MMETSP0794_2-20130614/18419_1 /TAXON_ID=515487 /ORGANISM="Stephanopyxis turris, Strain CCMP 815" /LENGTH=290 /DNA_ID=CAMNT_0040650827 /DNA_START=73 /DNA_END=945 /DNA_ORIENTATION=-
MPASELYWDVRNRKWSQVISTAESKPCQARFRDRVGYTALHQACSLDPPVEVVVYLLNAYPEAISLQNKWGETPLHYACIYSKHEVVRTLLRSSIEIIHTRNMETFTSLEYLCHLRGYKLSAAVRRSLPPSKEVLSELLTEDEELTRIWNNAHLLVETAYHNPPNGSLKGDKKFRILHACAEMEICPADFLQAAVKLYPEQLKEVDEDGYLPLHLAARSGKMWSQGVATFVEAHPAALASLAIDERYYPNVLAFLGRQSSLSTLFGVLQQIPVIMSASPSNVRKRTIQEI